MRKVYYKYNPKTQAYDRIYPTFKHRVITALRRFFANAGVAAVIFVILIMIFGLPSEKELKSENSRLLSQYKLMSRELDNALAVLEDIRMRDDNLYRVMFNADPIPEDVRQFDFAGTARYDSLESMDNARLVIATTAKLDLLKRQLYVQSNSFDEIVQMYRGKDEMYKCIPAIQPVANKNLKQMASGYGNRIDPIYGTVRYHAGMDFSAAVGTDIYATGDGTVEDAGWESGYGNCVVIDHGYGYKTRYAHMSRIGVRRGEKVIRGQVIGAVGNTGKSTGPHLHYEVIVKGRTVNPVNYYYMDLTPEEYDEMIKVAETRGNMMD
ncbi:MAG TPA: M23 family metallopeptidase [Candidatus Avibacteroides avistercoris]|uniref:M23 family metallopeptidase n=1 Tax=Candidatus Avibacteroides avistercoris TaxID=2840690 RepID=A0A9D2UIM1_9BACT|nr:M23 family metallopeptidase [Candidatus Avibacteroides avistercoris]